MTSEALQAAARANGRAASGRKSAAGKASSARNAFRHGLSVPLAADQAASAEIAALAREIAPPVETGRRDEAAAELAQRIAEAQLDLVRVRRARHDLIVGALAGSTGVPHGVSSRIAGQKALLLERAERLANQRGPWASLLDTIVAQLRRAPTPADKLAQVIADLAPRLDAMDRYERRARWRRARAIEAYDGNIVFQQSIVVTSRTKLNSDSCFREDSG